MDLDTDIIIIGAGMSGLGLAVQLVRQYGHRNFELIEKSDHIGGTWWTNSYPGCGVDIIAHFYSYSFALNPNWSRKYPLQPEIIEYIQNVAARYDIEKHTRFQSVVTSADWEESSGTWLVSIKDLKTLEIYERRCKILISAVGILSIPNKCDIPGVASFKGRMFHTSEWDHSFDWKDKEVVVIGNGCSATQVVPAVSQSPNAAKKVTQFARSAQWVLERPNPEYSGLFKWTMRWVPLAMRSYRLMQNYYTEWDFKSFPSESGAPIRKMYQDYQGGYIRRTSPEKYHEFLLPKSEIGCKRRVMDTDYLGCLHRDNVELIYKDPIEEIVEDGVRTKSGRVIEADAIILANGFEIQRPLLTLNIHGEGGATIADHWDEFSDGSASAYFGTCLSGFPNFFIMMGPNTASGHGSVIYTTECQIGFALRVIKPILNALSAQRSMLPVIGKKADIVKVTPDAEQVDIDTVQDRLKGLVWSTGCTSWALDPRTGRNITMYPDFQYKYWLRSIFVAWRDFEFSTSKPAAAVLASKSLGVGSLFTISTGIAVVAYLAHQRYPFGRLR
ncbi:putative flavin monooxygenase FMO [Rosellinia necatrix]|uniref:Putative flavin monooxygenase FMO n=1 Tax=Rosellinia necatrix TaxID=77044 RepID=A0A1W2TM61_ROSNE|nr:putative flavin monooxygenase FMO [Rosellinia necatrix]